MARLILVRACYFEVNFNGFSHLFGNSMKDITYLGYLSVSS